jgi:hypothetical protein
MKSIFPLLTLGLGLLTFSANAQMADRLHPEPASRQMPTNPTEYTRAMANRLHLNEAQYLKLLPVNRTRMARLTAINRQYKNDETTRAAKIAELDSYYEQECSRILTPSQLSQLQHEKPQPATQPAETGNGLG